MFFTRAALVLSTAFALTGCSDSPTSGTPDDPAGRVSFRYSSSFAPLNGSFAAEGVVPEGATLLENVGAPYAFAFGDGTAYTIVGSSPRPGHHEVVRIMPPRRGRQTYSFSPDCTDVLVCPWIGFVVTASVAGRETDYACYMSTGTLATTRVSRRRIAGEFAGTGWCYPVGLDPSTAERTIIAVTDGAFDTPITIEL